MDIIKLYGERNTGTNYLSRITALNTNAVMLKGTAPEFGILRRFEFLKDGYFYFTQHENLGWKHSIPDVEAIKKHKDFNNLKIITVTKNPYSFLLSLFRKPYQIIGKRPATFDEFLKRKWITVNRENYKPKIFKSPAELWNAKNEAYISLHQKTNLPVLNLTYEKLLEDPEATISHIIQELKLQSKNGFTNIARSTKEKGKDYDYYKDYYLNELWRKELNDGQIKLINQYLNKDLLKHFGYSLIT